MIEHPDPDALMAGPLGGWLRGLEAEREATRRKCAKVRNWGIGAAVVVAVLVILVSGRVSTAMMLGFFTGMGGFGLAEWIKRPMIDKLKGGINGAIAEALGLQYQVEVEPGEAFAWARQFDLLPSYDNERFQDLWQGDLAGRPFTLHEAVLTEQRGSGKSRRTVTVFSGSIMAISFARRFNGATVIEADGERRKFLIGAEKERTTIGGIEMQRIDLVSPAFEERFSVWSSDPVEGQYLVHPDYVERLLAVEQAFAGEKVRALFYQGALVIVLETGDLFESGSLQPEEDRDLLARSIRQFGALADLAAKLNERERMTFADLSSAGP